LLNSLKAIVKRYLLKYPLQSLQKNITKTYQPKSYSESLETNFETSDGRLIPVLKNHRYSLKKCWRIFGPLSALSELNNRGLLDEKTKKFLKHAIGYRTPQESLEAVREKLSPYLNRHADLFITTNIPDIGKRLFKPSLVETEAVIKEKASTHLKILDKIKNLVEAPPKSGERSLEIGYTSGGESVIGLERVGFHSMGLDNYYEGNVEPLNRHQYISKLTGTRVEFLLGDITGETSIKENTLAYIYSLSVIEHINDISAAFKEMYRILRPGGVMFHTYDPYFHVRGGHSHGTLDSPWAHMRMLPKDIEAYIRLLRPHEAEAVLPLVRHGLNRNHTQAQVQSALTKAKFEIRHWQTSPVAPSQSKNLTGAIAKECIAVNEGVTLSDLSSSNITFIAEKPMK
jgi:ubiquinone/menaquinone biosynthesis C-methylase UbiE